MQIRLERDLAGLPVVEYPLRVVVNHRIAPAHAAENDFLEEILLKNIVSVKGLTAPCLENVGVDCLVLVGGEVGQ